MASVAGVLQHLAALGMAVVGVARSAANLQTVVDHARAQGGVADPFVGRHH